MENVLKCMSASTGYAQGKVFLLANDEPVLNYEKTLDPTIELARFENAKQKTILDIKALHQKAMIEVGEEHAEIFNVHAMMLEDLDYNDNIQSLICDEHSHAEVAVHQTATVFSQMFSSMDDEYMKARAADVLDISTRLIKNILNITGASLDDCKQPMIIVAEDLFPSDTLQLDKTKVLAFVTEHGSKNSHTAILARTLGIPAIVSAKDILKNVSNDDFMIVDGETGTLILNPTENTQKMYSEKIQQLQEKQVRLQKLKGVRSQTLDGVHIETCANIGNVADLNAVLENDAEGIGLFRSEFIYLDSKDFPTEDFQFNIYKEVLSKMEGKRVIIRTLDLGADKQAAYFNIPNEENPAMGYRAIRICLEERTIFKTQLRALLRASVYGKLAIMFPMIISESEIIEVKDYIEQMKRELTNEGIPFADDFEIGVMIETPAAAIVSDKLAKHVDFFSIGTNDLTQYTLAVDRMNSKIAHLYDYANEAVLRLMKMTVDHAHANNVWVGICGESAGDLSLTETYIAMGIDELSCSPKIILALREKILSSNASQLKEKISF